MTVTIRRMHGYDLESICWAGGRRHLETISTALMRSDTIFLLAIQNEQALAIGAVRYTDDAPDTGYLRFVQTEQKHEGEGLATAIIFNLETLIVERGCSHAELYVEAENHRAIYLYQHLGYGIVGEADDAFASESTGDTSPYGAVKHYLMRKDLRTVHPTDSSTVIE